MAKKDFNFKWKLIENYFNALMVIVFVSLILLAILSGDITYIILLVIGVIVGPFMATFIDRKSQAE